jgi:hypothetical protein
MMVMTVKKSVESVEGETEALGEKEFPERTIRLLSVNRQGPNRK